MFLLQLWPNYEQQLQIFCISIWSKTDFPKYCTKNNCCRIQRNRDSRYRNSLVSRKVRCGNMFISHKLQHAEYGGIETVSPANLYMKRYSFRISSNLEKQQGWQPLASINNKEFQNECKGEHHIQPQGIHTRNIVAYLPPTTMSRFYHNGISNVFSLIFQEFNILFISMVTRNKWHSSCSHYSLWCTNIETVWVHSCIFVNSWVMTTQA